MRGGELSGAFCRKCGREITRDEIAVTKKLINRGSETFCCAPCLAAHFRVDEQVIRDKIAQFREMGCTLFDDEA